MRDRSPNQLVRNLRTAILVCFLVIGLLACTRGQPNNEPPEEAPTPATPALLDTPVLPEPSATLPPEKVMLVVPAGAEENLVSGISAILQELVLQNGMEVQSVVSISQIDFNSPIRVVVALSPDPGISQTAGEHPGIQFLGIEIPGLQISNNLSSIGSDGERPDRQGFIAGYLAAVISDDWRIGVISQSDTPDGQANRLGFINGAVFYCGLCRPVYPPFIQYPQYVEVPSSAGPAEWQAAADQLIANAVKTIFIQPKLVDENILSQLAQAGINIIGSTQPGVDINERWVASVQPDVSIALREIWPTLMAGDGGKQLSIPIIIAHQNAQLFSPGRQELVNKLLSDLNADYVDTGIDPLTGAEK